MQHRNTLILRILLLLTLGLAPPSVLAVPPQYNVLRARLVYDVVKPSGITEPRVLRSLLDTPRHEFVPRHLKSQAYFDMALPIGDRQTISSPFIVAFMTESLELQPSDRVLEIGTGSGYQAAILSPLVEDVYSIEIVESLGKRATQTLRRLGYENVHTKIGDGFQGWPEHAPFDKIIVTCSPENVPQPLVQQLAEGGVIVVPVGQRYQQVLYRLRKVKGEMVRESLRTTLFVPMTGRAEQARRVQPDPAHPTVQNGDFEKPLPENGFVSGWYYQRQLELESSPSTPSGKSYITFNNTDRSRSAHLLQGIPIDGSQIKRIQLSGWVKTRNIHLGTRTHEVPMIAVSFYDEKRNDLGFHFLGPFLGDTDWRKVKRNLVVPGAARELILRVGLFGATGTASFDQIQIEPIAK
jgi:protein-L-isoaspartate(D-aspartate) O-methyltransferase